MPTPDIFDFNPDRLASYDPDAIDAVLVEQPALYLNHLRIAHHVAGWADRLAESGGAVDEQFQKGYVQALREIAAHLRQADYVEGGIMLRDDHPPGSKPRS